MFDPPPVLPLSGYVPPVNALNYGVTARRLRRYLLERDLWPPRAIVANFPKQLHALPWFPGMPVVYDVMDDYPLFYGRWQGSVLGRMHRQLLHTASAVVASSETLAERCAPLARSVHCISNGVNEGFVAECLHAAPDPEIQALPAPRLGYVGSIAPWFDFAIVCALARAFPEGSVVLVGPVETALPALPPNVLFLGPRPHARLPAVLNAFDLGLIPFRVLPSIDAVNPVKVYEYFAAGLPVLTSAFREILPFGSLVKVCRTQDDWVTAAIAALRQRPAAATVAQQRACARGNFWSAKAAAFLAVVDALAPDESCRKAG